MLNVTDHYCISPAISKGGFPVIRVICHESVIYVTGHASHRSESLFLFWSCPHLQIKWYIISDHAAALLTRSPCEICLNIETSAHVLALGLLITKENVC